MARLVVAAMLVLCVTACSSSKHSATTTAATSGLIPGTVSVYDESKDHSVLISVVLTS